MTGVALDPITSPPWVPVSRATTCPTSGRPGRRDVLAGLASSLLPVAAIGAGRTDTLAALERASGGRLGVYALDTGTGRSLGHRADERFLMCSTFKLLLAAAVLARVGAGRERLDRRVPYTASDLLPYAPVSRAHLADGSLPIGALCQAAVEVSDNTAANLLLASIGGPTSVTRFARSLGDGVTRLDSDRIYGARRVWHDVLAGGASCGLHHVERLMREEALRARPRRRGLPADKGERSCAAIAANVLDRQFEASAPNQRWVADFTYVWTAEGWLYVAAVIDLFSRRVVGWSMNAAMTAQLVADALMMAIWRRGKPHALLHNSDQGSQLEFSRSSQRLSGPTEDARQTPRQVSSSQGSCAAWC